MREYALLLCPGVNDQGSSLFTETLPSMFLANTPPHALPLPRHSGCCSLVLWLSTSSQHCGGEMSQEASPSIAVLY